MDDDLRSSMLRYYDERAPEYEEAFVLGTGTASIPDPQIFREEAGLLGAVVERWAHGRLMDLACGTGYWLPHYAPQCSQITLFDQSEGMLDECRKKIAVHGIAGKCRLIHGDFFDHEFDSHSYDCALVGFFLSHLTEIQEHSLFSALRNMLGTAGRFLVLDSAWSPARTRHNVKVERQQRRLNNGTPFDIYKRYCDRDDVLSWADRYHATLSIEHFGAAFFAVSGQFTDGMPTKAI